MRRLTSRTALENEALNPDATDPATVVTADLPEQTEDHPDFTAEIDEICTLSDSTEAAADVVNSLDEVAETLSGPEDQVSEAAVKLGAIATEHLFASAGYAVSLEDDESGKSLVSKITDGAKKIWEKIIAAINKARDWLMTFFRKLIDRSASLQKQAQEYAKEADAREGDAKETTFKNGWLAMHLQFRGGIPKEFSGPANGTHQILAAQLKRLDASTAEGKTMAATLVNSPEKFKYKADDRRAASGMPHTGVQSGPFGLKMKVAHSDPLVGGRVVVEKLGMKMMFDSDHLAWEGASAIARMINTPSLQYFVGGPLARKNAIEMHKFAFATASLSEAKLCAGIVADMAGEVNAFRGTITKLEGVCRDFASECKKLISSAEKNMSYAERKESVNFSDVRKAQRAFFSAAPRMFVSEPAAFANEILSVASALLGYVKTSLKQYARKPNAGKDPFGTDPKDPFNTKVALPAPAAA